MGGGPLPGNDILAAELEGMAERAGDPEPVMAAMVSSFHKIEAARWTSEGPGWEPLSENTDKRKASGDFDDLGMMMRTGDLQTSLTTGGTISPFTWSVISDVAYAGFHQSGTDRMPQRKLVDINPATIALWMQMIESYIIGGDVSEMVDGQVAGVL